MSDDTYEDPDSSSINIKPSSNTENIYMNAVPKRSQQRMKHSEIQDRSGGHGPYKLAVVILGLLCVLLLAVLCIKTEEARHLQLRYNNLAGERDELRLWKLESDDMKRIKSHAVNVTLDPDTARSYLFLSADRKQVKVGNTGPALPDNPKRFGIYPRVLGKQGFSAGKFYYEVQVKGKTEWDLGVAKESINRTGNRIACPEDGYWTIQLRNVTYEALDSRSVHLSLKEKPQRVGVFVDYEAGLVSFYDADYWYHLYSFTNVIFTEKLYPFFNPGFISTAGNSSPLIISSVHICPI